MKITKTQLKQMIQEAVKSKLNEATQGYEYLEHLRGYMDDTQILDELVQAMSSNEAKENFEHIMDSWDVPYGSLSEAKDKDPIAADYDRAAKKQKVAFKKYQEAKKTGSKKEIEKAKRELEQERHVGH